MAKILCIETSTQVCSAALADNGLVTDYRETLSGQEHSKLLTVFIRELLNRNHLKASGLDAVAVSEGPGSYTGLRIGVSAAKGICYAAGIPLIAVSPLQAMATQLSLHPQKYNVPINPNDMLAPMIDARRMEVYTALYNCKAETIRKVDAVVVDETTFLPYLRNSKVCFMGNGAAKCRLVIRHSNALFVEGVIASALNMASLAQQKFDSGQFVDLAYFEPFYLKDFIATTPKNNVLKF